MPGDPPLPTPHPVRKGAEGQREVKGGEVSQGLERGERRGRLRVPR